MSSGDATNTLVCCACLYIYICIQTPVTCTTGCILGFADLGYLNNHLLAYEKFIEEGKEKETVAKSMMVIMVGGLFSKLQFAYAQFPCATVCGYHMYDILWEAVEHLKRCGFRVIACTCDGLSVNRNFFK